MDRRVVTVFGGSGFIGRHLVRRLAARGESVRVAVRDPEAAHFLQPLGEPGQIVAVAVDVRDAPGVAAALAGAKAAVNLVGILFEFGRQRFDALHAEGAANVARAAASAGVERLVHLSAIGASPASPAAYGRSKAAGEAAVHAAFPQATILRPSVVFGPEDGFFNRFGALARLSPVLPVIGAPCPSLKRRAGGGYALDLFGDGGPRMQPVYVGDVAEAIVRALDDLAHGGRTYELGGPRVYSFKEIMELVLEATRRRRMLVPLPFALADLQGALLGLLPKPLLTRDQVAMLRTDNVVAAGARTLADLGIDAQPAEAIVAGYLNRYRPAALQRLRL